MRKNPFSLYDFLGYVFPGALTILIVYFFTDNTEIKGSMNLYHHAVSFLSKFHTNGSWLEETIILTLASYIVGHLVAYLSSITIEQYAIWVYDYPSRFLLNDIPSWHFWTAYSEYGRHKIIKILWRCAIAIFVLPITLCTLIIGKILRVKYFFIKKLDSHLISAINDNKIRLAQYLGVNLDMNSDFHRIIYHYEYEHLNRHSIKLDNYVALYGFLRSITFICNCVFMWLFGWYACPSFRYFNDYTPNWKFVLLLCIMAFATYLFFMGFMKFYLRFTLESFMCLVVDTSYKKSEPTEFKYSNMTDTNSMNQDL